MTDTPKLPPKKEVAEALLQGTSMFVHLDPRCDGVVVPKWLKSQAQLVLQIGMNMVVPIPDLTVDDDGISCTLSFNRSPIWCTLPWSAVYALVGEEGRGMIWPDDAPPELAAQPQRPALKVVGKKKMPKKTKAKLDGEKAGAAKLEDVSAQPEPLVEEAGETDAPRPQLAAVPSLDDDGGKDGKRGLPPYLRVIK